MRLFLRPDLAREPESLFDPVFDRRIDLGPSTAALVAALDGRTAAEVVAALAPAHGPPARVERMLRRFFLLELVDGVSQGVVDRMRAVRRGEAALAHTVLAGSRFECQGSGGCCQGHRLGPLADADVARLAELGVADAVVEIPDGRFLRQVDGRCGFLLADNRCDLHARFGADAKPGMCRLYPIEQVATLEGIKLYDRGSCQTLAVSARAGLPLAAQLPELRPVLPAKPPLHHPVVRLDDRTVFDYAHFLPFARAAIDLVERRLWRPAQALGALHALLRGLGAALETFDLAAGEPDRARDAALAAVPEVAEESAGVMQEGAEMLSVVVADLAELAPTLEPTFGARLAGQMAALCARLRDECLEAADGGALAPAGIDDVLSLSLRQSLFGPRALVADRPVAGQLRMAVLLAAAACGARAGDPSLAHSLAARLLDVGVAGAVLVQHEELTPSLLAGLPLLC